MVGASCFIYTIHHTALVAVHIHVYACRFSAYSVQHAMAILVWRIVPDVLLCKAFAGSLYIGRYLRRIAVHGGI